MDSFLTRATELLPQIVESRRIIHRFAGVGYDLKDSADYIRGELMKSGITVSEICSCGLVATIGHGEPVFLLRADYDALPFQEATGLDFAAQNGSCHACGHDFHSSMLLWAAKILKERESQLCGTVKLMFQPAEEGGGGCEAMVKAGVLEHPRVDAAMAVHVAVGNEGSSVGKLYYSRGAAYAAGNAVTITVRGKGGHGAMPHHAVDPVSIAAQIITSLQRIIAMEIASDDRMVLTFGSIHGGSAPNVITDEVQIRGTLRTFDEEVREFAIRRIDEIAQGVAKSMRAEAEVIIPKGGQAVMNDPALCQQLFPIFEDVMGEGNVAMIDRPTSYGGEDFSVISHLVPSVAIKLGTGSPEEGYSLPIHNPAVTFDERALAHGSAVYAGAAFYWLKTHSK